MQVEISYPIQELERVGATFAVVDGNIHVYSNNPSALKPALTDMLRARKPEALAYLAQRQTDVPAPAAPHRELPPGDPYSARLRAALLSTCTSDYPAGLIPWLATAQPDLYTALTATLPDEIHCLWSEGASLAEFDEVLARLLEVHRRARVIYLAAKGDSQ